jgi:hypothetical protein
MHVSLTQGEDMKRTGTFLLMMTGAIVTSGCASDTGEGLRPVVARSSDTGAIVIGAVYDGDEGVVYFNADLAGEVAEREAAGADLVVRAGEASADLTADGVARLTIAEEDVLAIEVHEAGRVEEIAGFVLAPAGLIDELSEADGATRFPGCYPVIQ